MPQEYPYYRRNELQEVKKVLPEKDKKLLLDFLKFCSITAGKGKLLKIERCILQLADVTKKALDKITKSDLIDFLSLLNASKKEKWTKNEVKIYVKKFIKWQYKDIELLELIKLDKSPLNDKKVNENVLLTEEEFEKLLRAAKSLKEKALLITLYESGFRPQELLNLKWRDIKFNDDGITDATVYSNKTGQSRPFPLKEATIHLKRWKQEYSFLNVKPEDYIFPSKIREKPWTTYYLNRFLKLLAKKVGITKNIWTYLFRHTKASMLYEILPEQIAEKLLGHKGMAKIYAHISSKKARDELIRKVYGIEEINPEHAKKIKEQIEELKKENQKLWNGLDYLISITKKLLEISTINKKVEIVYKNKLDKIIPENRA